MVRLAQSFEHDLILQEEDSHYFSHFSTPQISAMKSLGTFQQLVDRCFLICTVQKEAFNVYCLHITTVQFLGGFFSYHTFFWCLDSADVIVKNHGKNPSFTKSPLFFGVKTFVKKKT